VHQLCDAFSQTQGGGVTVSRSEYPIRVVGCGSPHGDDALGWEIIRLLRHEDLPAEVELHAAEGGHQILDVIDGQGTLVLVDAMASVTAPGTVHRYVWPDLPVESLRPGTTHHLRPAEALRLAAALGLLPPRVIVWGIEAESFEAQTDLSTAIAIAVPELVRRITEELNRARDVAPAGAAGTD
jgi:hydrogenase maturation protease